MPKGTSKNANGQLQATILKKCDRTGHRPETSKACAARDAGEAGDLSAHVRAVPGGEVPAQVDGSLHGQRRAAGTVVRR